MATTSLSLISLTASLLLRFFSILSVSLSLSLTSIIFFKIFVLPFIAFATVNYVNIVDCFVVIFVFVFVFALVNMAFFCFLFVSVFVVVFVSASLWFCDWCTWFTRSLFCSCHSHF